MLIGACDPMRCPFNGAHSGSSLLPPIIQADTVTKFGSGAKTLADLLQPAIRMAEEGEIARSQGRWSQTIMKGPTCLCAVGVLLLDCSHFRDSRRRTRGPFRGQ